MGVRDDIGVAKASWKVALASVLGVEVQLSHRGAANVTLKAKITREGNELVQDGHVLEERRVLRLEVPVQTGFAYTSAEGEPVTPGDKVTFNAREHAVLDPIEKDSTGRVYYLRVSQNKTLNLG